MFLKIYDYMRCHRAVWMILFVSVTSLLVLNILRIDYKEDISDFLPLEDNSQGALKVYQNISGANNFIALFEYRDTTKADPDVMTGAVDAFLSAIEQGKTDGRIANVLAQVDIEKLSNTTDFIYHNIPYFLDESDYRRIDSLMAQDNYIARQLEEDKHILMLPVGSMLSSNIGRDPLNFFTPVVETLRQSSVGMNFELYDGYIFSADMMKAVVVVTSPYGSSETEHNAQLLAFLDSCGTAVGAAFDNVDVHFTGGPVIAVGNARQIKSDSMLSVGVAVSLILILLLFVFRNFKNLFLITLSICWGWIFGLGGLALVNSNISIIVIGISSVILGIAVNYPLHLIAHLYHVSDVRAAIKEIVTPLLVGNITTVGAFLSLVPLQSVALRDLGLFSSFLLLGTIFFVLIFLPHIVTPHKPVRVPLLEKISSITPENHPLLIAAIVIMTLVFGYFSNQTEFDANMSHINYMTDVQKSDMAYFQRMMRNSGSTEILYVLSTDSTLDGALDKSLSVQEYFDSLQRQGVIERHASCTRFLASRAEQERRLALWNKFTDRYREKLKKELPAIAASAGFSAASFDEFTAILNGSYSAGDGRYILHELSAMFASNVSIDSIGHRYDVVDVLHVSSDKVDGIREAVGSRLCGHYCFDIASLNSTLANNLSDNFNYIGWACSLIVFFFLWFSLGHVELAVLSFLPMALSWLWILGIMALLGIQFNIVNIILATFIFGQGDDYTIFMTEGASYEYAYRRKMLSSYKSSIVISALIMFIGIGSLIFARHPALHSLAEVTIVGMFSVVLMAYIFPPLIFRFLVRSSSGYRRRPLTFRSLFAMFVCGSFFFAELVSVYVLGFVLFGLLPFKESRRRLFRRYVQFLYRFDFKYIHWVDFDIRNPFGEHFDTPALVTCNHQSMLDSALFMALTTKTVLVANSHASGNYVVKQIFKWMGYYTLSADNDENLRAMRGFIGQGYSIVVFPEGERNAESSILRFHKGACYLASELGLDIVPVVIHGVNTVLPRNSYQVFDGLITISIEKRRRYADDYRVATKTLHHFYVERYEEIRREVEKPDYFLRLVLDRYKYKGYDVVKTVKKSLRQYSAVPQFSSDLKQPGETVVFNDKGYGELALLYALSHRNEQVVLRIDDDDHRCIALYAAEGIVPNLIVE